MDIAFSVIALLGSCAQLSILLREFISSTINAPPIVLTLDKELHDFRYILSRIQTITHGSEILDPAKASLIDITHLSATIAGSAITVQELGRELDRVKARVKGHFWYRLRWARAEKSFNVIAQRLESHKTSLVLMLTVLSSESSTASDRGLLDILNKQVDHPNLVSRSARPIEFSSNPSLKSSAGSCHSLRSILRSSRPYRKPEYWDEDKMSMRKSVDTVGSWTECTDISNNAYFNLSPLSYKDRETGILPFARGLNHKPFFESGCELDSPPETLTLSASTRDATGRSGECALLAAIQRRENRMVHNLLQHGYDVNKKDSEQRSLLEHAVRLGFEDVVLTLLVFGADPETKDPNGRSALHIAVDKSDTFIAHCLLKSGAQVNAVDKEGSTPLHLAIEHGERDIINMLLHWGGDMGKINGKGETPLSGLKSNGYSGK